MKKNKSKTAISIEEDCLFHEDTLRPFSRSLPMSLLLAREAVMQGFRRLLKENNLNEH